MKKIAINILIIIYFLVALLITYFLLSYNKYNTVEINNKYILTLKEDNEKYKKSDLLIISKENELENNDYVFYYDTYASNVIVKYEKIAKVEKINEGEQEVILDNELVLSSENILGKEKNTVSYHLLGTIFNILTSKWGYLLIIIFPMLIAFVYEIYSIINEIKRK